jgi:selenocysteine-specific elongation factor
MESYSYYERLEKLSENIDTTKILNLNVGLLGHIDSGKTSLAKRLSTIASTASFDKNPQSKERGITLDLGFSAFYIKTPSFLKESYPGNERLVNSDYLQITLVDCPGHASLIRTVIAGANIIDTIVLVIDVVKGIQTQTTECLILGEILSDKLVVALNKIDMLEGGEKELDLKISKLRIAFGYTKFGKEVPIKPVAADPKKEGEKYEINIYSLINSIIDSIDFNKKQEDFVKCLNKKDLLFSIDHCFTIKNKGTIVTGTILKGKIQVNDEIYFPEICEKKVVKEMQMFRKPLLKAFQGDRLGMLIKNLDHTKIERSLACSDGYVQNSEGGIFILKKINFYKQDIKSRTKLFIIVGNQGVMAKCVFFKNFNFDLQSQIDKGDRIQNIESAHFIKQLFTNEYSFLDNLPSDEYTFAYLKFDNKLLIPPDAIVLGSKIDFDVSYKSNRIAFFGKMILNTNITNTHVGQNSLNQIKIYKMKSKIGQILRMKNEKTAIVKGLFKKDSNVEDFINKTVVIKESEGKIIGIISSTFGESGKVTVEFNTEIKDLKLINEEGKEIDYNSFSIILEYKKYMKLNKI